MVRWLLFWVLLQKSSCEVSAERFLCVILGSEGVAPPNIETNVSGLLLFCFVIFVSAIWNETSLGAQVRRHGGFTVNRRFSNVIMNQVEW